MTRDERTQIRAEAFEQAADPARLISEWEDATGIIVSTHTRIMMRFFAKWLAKDGRLTV